MKSLGRIWVLALNTYREAVRDKLLYNLLVDADRGPRLPTLFVALGAEKVRSLLTA